MSPSSSEGKFPFGRKDREKRIERYRESVKGRAENEEKRDPKTIYSIYDSSLNKFGADSNFDITFQPLLDERNQSLRSYIEGSLEKKKGRAIGIEFGGTGSNLFSGFSRGFFSRSLGVALADTRNRLDVDPTPEDEKRHHSVLAGDLTNLETYEHVREWLGTEKADLIIERLAGEHYSLPEEPNLLGKVFDAWYSLLAEEGIILAQTTRWMRPLIAPWVELIQKNYAGSLEVDHHHGSELDLFDAILLRKLPSAPEKLPILDPRTVREISKKSFREEV